MRGPRLGARAGLSLLEVLFSIFIIGTGMVGFALLIPLGTHHVTQSEQMDRAVTVGNAAFRQIEAQGMLDLTTWFNGSDQTEVTPFVLDPLLMVWNSNATLFPYSRPVDNSVSMPRRGIVGSPALVAQIFTARDDIAMAPGADQEARPQAVLMRDSNDKIMGVHGYEGVYSWMVMVTPAPSEDVPAESLDNKSTRADQKRLFRASVIVFAGRAVQAPGGSSGAPAIERQVPVVRLVGNGLELKGNSRAPLGPIQANQWIMLSGRLIGNPPRQYHAWYRVLSVGNTDNSGERVFLTLAGPDWPTAIMRSPYNSRPVATVCDGVVGVFERNVRLDVNSLSSNGGAGGSQF